MQVIYPSPPPKKYVINSLAKGIYSHCRLLRHPINAGEWKPSPLLLPWSLPQRLHPLVPRRRELDALRRPAAWCGGQRWTLQCLQHFASWEGEPEPAVYLHTVVSHREFWSRKDHWSTQTKQTKCGRRCRQPESQYHSRLDHGSNSYSSLWQFAETNDTNR